MIDVMLRRALVVVTAAGVFTAGCATPAKKVDVGEGAPTASASETGEPRVNLPPPDPSPAPEADDALALFGPSHGFRFEDGLTVQVVSATRFRASTDAISSTPGAQGVLLIIRVKNDTSEIIDLTQLQVSVSAGANGNQAERIFDIDNNIGVGFETAVAPGRVAQARFGFAVAKADLPRITVEVQPSPDHGKVLFDGTVS